MDIKALLLEGGTISFPYKVSKDSWIGEIKLYVLNGYSSSHSKPIIILEYALERKQWDIDKIDEAIEAFKQKAYNKTNLWYKIDIAQRMLGEKGIFVDMDIDSDYKKVMKLRKELINGKNS